MGSEAEVFMSWMLFLSLNQQHQSTKGKQITMPHILQVLLYYSVLQKGRKNLTKLSLI